jgi:hypothetical protein
MICTVDNKKTSKLAVVGHWGRKEKEKNESHDAFFFREQSRI